MATNTYYRLKSKIFFKKNKIRLSYSLVLLIPIPSKSQYYYDITFIYLYDNIYLITSI